MDSGTRPHAPDPDLDESAWVYLAAHHRDVDVGASQFESWVYLAAHHRDVDVGASQFESFADLLADTCARFGFLGSVASANARCTVRRSSAEAAW
jgi:hypothetical protein